VVEDDPLSGRSIHLERSLQDYSMAYTTSIPNPREFNETLDGELIKVHSLDLLAF
jgi:hypothetical protein